MNRMRQTAYVLKLESSQSFAESVVKEGRERGEKEVPDSIDYYRGMAKAFKLARQYFEERKGAKQ